jgi:hypothetical protein
MQEEGGVSFDIGVLPYTLCGYCWNGVSDGVEEMRGECIHCGKLPYTPKQEEEEK